MSVPSDILMESSQFAILPCISDYIIVLNYADSSGELWRAADKMYLKCFIPDGSHRILNNSCLMRVSSTCNTRVHMISVLLIFLAGVPSHGIHSQLIACKLQVDQKHNNNHLLQAVKQVVWLDLISNRPLTMDCACRCCWSNWLSIDFIIAALKTDPFQAKSLIALETNWILQYWRNNRKAWCFRFESSSSVELMCTPKKDSPDFIWSYNSLCLKEFIGTGVSCFRKCKINRNPFIGLIMFVDGF